MSTENLWGELPSSENQKTPVQILKEQASILTQLTKGVLVGSVAPQDTRQPFSYVLGIRAPALNNYSAAILSIGHTIEMYPLVLQNQISGNSQRCDDENAFIQAISRILKDEKTHRVIKALLVQSNVAPKSQ